MSLPLLLRPARKRWRYDLTAGVLPPVLSVTRASTATYIAASGLIASAAANEARFDCDPITHAARGLLIEAQATNLCAHSRALGASPWSVGGGTLTQNAAVGIDGTSVADVWQYQDAAYRWRDDTAAAFITATTTYSIAAGWVRITSTVTAPAGCTTLRYYAARNDSPSRFVYYTITCAPGQTYTATHYAQVSGSGMAIDAVQIEAGAFPTTWIPTAGTTSTRDADVVTVSDNSRAYRITYEPLTGGSAQTLDVAAGQQPPATPGRWLSIQQQ